MDETLNLDFLKLLFNKINILLQYSADLTERKSLSISKINNNTEKRKLTKTLNRKRNLDAFSLRIWF